MLVNIKSLIKSLSLLGLVILVIVHYVFQETSLEDQSTIKNENNMTGLQAFEEVTFRKRNERSSKTNETDVLNSNQLSEQSSSSDAKEKKSNMTLLVFDPNSDMTQREQFLKVFSDHFSSIVSEKTGNLTEQEKKIIDDYTFKLNQLRIKNNWDEYMEVVELFNSEYPEALNAITNSALLTQVPTDIVKQLVALGGEVNSMSLIPLVRAGDMESLLYFENNGVDLDLDVVPNFNLLDMALTTNIPSDSFLYLVQRIEPNIETTPFGTDTLAIALINAEENPDNVSSYLQLLLSNGAIIKDEHKQYLQGLKLENNQLYEEIVSAVPDFNL